LEILKPVKTELADGSRTKSAGRHRARRRRKTI